MTSSAITRTFQVAATTVCCLLMLSIFSSVSYAEEEVPVIELYSMGVGEHFTEKFGHTAICVRYPKSPRFDLCYNYGTTNFQDPVGMAWGFVRGQSEFWVSTQTPRVMLNLYTQRDRDVWVQKLILPPDQAIDIAAQLVFDSLEENRYYRYHHYSDNCATRIRDLIDAKTGGVLSRDADSVIGPSFRDLTRQGFSDMPMLVIASDYVLGRIGDKHPTEYEAMFLPRVLREAVRQRMGSEPVVVYKRRGKDFGTDPGHGRLWVFLITLFLVVPVWWGWRRGTLRRLQMAPAILGLFTAGFFLWGLAVISPLPMARLNENLLIFFPGDIALLFLSAGKRQRYAQVRVVIVLLVSLLALVGILQQPLWVVSALPVLALTPLALPLFKRNPE